MRSNRSLHVLVLALAMTGALACSDATAPQAPSLGLGSLLGGATSTVTGLVNGITGFLVCSPRTEQVDTFTVDARGGSFAVDYAHVTIPRNAVSGSRTFEMRTPTASTRSVIFSPIDGRGTMTFAAPARVAIQYGGCLQVSLTKKLVYTTDADNPGTGLPDVLSLIGGIDNLLTMTVEGETSHFSRYAVSY